MEIWDGYLSDGTLAGVDLVRGEPIPHGIHHLVSEILVRHTDGDFLLMKRDERKPNWGGYFEATAGGSAVKGEDAYTCALRELSEETGIKPLSCVEIGVYLSKYTIYHNYLCVTDCDKTKITLQDGETSEFKWISESAFIEFINSDKMIPTQRLHYNEFFKENGYIVEPKGDTE